jgi:small subunit ribosomal protein S1
VSGAFGAGVYPKITLTHKELLGTWQQNASKFSAGETVSGVVRSVENYGIFVELLPNLAGLAELRDNVFVNQAVSVYIKAIIPEKMKIKLIIVDSFNNPRINYGYDYHITSGRLDNWVYSTEMSPKIIRTEFM